MPDASPVPRTSDELRSEIVRRHDGLSKRLQQVARYVLDAPDEIALETLAVIASRCHVQPSAIVRFAKTFGFEGASQMQKIFRDGLLSNRATIAYSERIRKLGNEERNGASDPGQLLAEFVGANVLSLQRLLQATDRGALQAAVKAIARSDCVHVAGFRRSFPVASYIAYSLLQARKRAILIDGVGGLAMAQIEASAIGDLLIAISFHPHAPETVEIVNAARMRGERIIAITDSAVGPIANAADILLQVRDPEVREFRSLSASMCLAQALVIGFAFEAERSAAKRKRVRSGR